MKVSRNRLFEIIEKGTQDDKVSLLYDAIMLTAIVASIIPLTFINTYPIFTYIEYVTLCIFILDYLFRWFTADLKLNKGWKSFLMYPFSAMALVDLLSILPGLNVLNSGFKIFRLTRLFKIIRIFKFLRYSEKIAILVRVLRKEQSVLLSVLLISIFYVFVTALVMFNAEPHINPETGTATFTNFFDALYWATVTLTTVGYGDLCPVTNIGRFVSMLSSLFGVAIIALPSGVITASYLDELRKTPKDNPYTENRYE